MKAKIDTIKLQMTYEEAEKLKEEFKSLVDDIVSLSTATDDDIISCHPTVKHFLDVINIEDDLPF